MGVSWLNHLRFNSCASLMSKSNQNVGQQQGFKSHNVSKTYFGLKNV